MRALEGDTMSMDLLVLTSTWLNKLDTMGSRHSWKRWA